MNPFSTWNIQLQGIVGLVLLKETIPHRLDAIFMKENAPKASAKINCTKSDAVKFALVQLLSLLSLSEVPK